MKKSFEHIALMLALFFAFILTGCERTEYLEPMGTSSEMKSALDKGDAEVMRSGDDEQLGDEGDDEGGLEDGDITDDNDDEDDNITDDNDDEDDDTSSAGEIIRNVPNGPEGAAFPGNDNDGVLRFRY